jgi:hypothetical protein
MLVVEGLSRRRNGKEERRKPDMPTYISLVNWTEKGITNVKETLRRADRSAGLAQKHGCTLVQLYWTWVPTTSSASSTPPTRVQAPTAWRSACGARSERPPFAPTTARRSQGSSKGSAEINEHLGPELLRSGPISRPYSPECVEEVFSEVYIHDSAYRRSYRARNYR